MNQKNDERADSTLFEITCLLMQQICEERSRNSELKIALLKVQDDLKSCQTDSDAWKRHFNDERDKFSRAVRDYQNAVNHGEALRLESKRKTKATNAWDSLFMSKP